MLEVPFITPNTRYGGDDVGMITGDSGGYGGGRSKDKGDSVNNDGSFIILDTRHGGDDVGMIAAW